MLYLLFHFFDHAAIDVWPWHIFSPNVVQISSFHPEILTFFESSVWRPPPIWIITVSEFGIFQHTLLLEFCIKFGSHIFYSPVSMIFLFVLCGGLSWLHVSFFLHLNTLHRIVSQLQCHNKFAYMRRDVEKYNISVIGWFGFITGITHAPWMVGSAHVHQLYGSGHPLY